MQRYSALSLAWRALHGHRGWRPAWSAKEPKHQYDVVVVGGGGHGLATAYYLARHHGIRNVAVLEKGWIGGGNSGRNTQVTRSNYFHLASCDFYDHSLRLYEGLAEQLNFNVMLSQRGVLTLAHSRHEYELMRRWSNSTRMNGIDSDLLSPEEIQRLVPIINLRARFPIEGGFVQWRGGIARHDAVVWGYARAANDLGVDIVQNCEVTGLHRQDGRITAVRTNRGEIRAERVCIAVAGHSSVLAAMAGLRLPIKCMALQACVSEPVKPILDTVVISPTIHVYASQADRGEIVFGGGADVYPSYAQRGDLATLESTIAALIELFPCFSRLKMMRQWAGIVDIAPDTSPIMGKTPVDGLYISTGWGTGGYKAIPAGGETMAWTIAHDKPHALIEPFSLERFARGALVDEGAAAGVVH